MACKQNRRRKLGSLSVDHTFSQYDITQDLKDTPEFEQFEDEVLTITLNMGNSIDTPKNLKDFFDIKHH